MEIEEKVKRCRKCGVEKVLKEFRPNKECRMGVEGTCIQCRKEITLKNLTHGLPARRKEKEYILPPEPAGVLPGYHLVVSEKGTTSLSKPITIDFYNYPNILQAIEEMAEVEFRPLEMQVLYMLKKQVDICSPNQLRG